MAMILTALEFLLATQNPDGGWGARKGKKSNTEATSFALLGLGVLAEPSVAKSIQSGLHWLSQSQKPNGSWPLTAEVGESSWTTPLATMAAGFFESHRSIALRGVDWLLQQKGRGVGLLGSALYWLAPERALIRLNPFLKGWPWTVGTFSWVEPTAYALIALKKLMPYVRDASIRERIEQGELMIYDRMCHGGGWNYGNSNVFGENLWPYPDITALVLIALQNHRTKEANQASLKALQKMLTKNESGLTLSWSILCFSLYGQEVAKWQDLLNRSYEKTGFLGETKSIALSLLASGKGTDVFQL